MKTTDIKHIVFKGGGFNGIAFLGSLTKLEELDFNFKNLETIAGTSIGALLALLVSIGYTPGDIQTIICQKNFAEFRTISLFNLLKKFGLDEGDKIIKWVEKLIIDKGFNAKITFKQLFGLTNKKLITVACNLNTYQTLYCDYTNTPDMEVLTGIKMSMAVPFLFTPVEYLGNYYVDGGMTEIFPMSLFLKNPENTLGIRLIYDRKNTINNIYEFGTRVLDCLLLRIENTQMEQYIDTFENIIEIKVNSDDFINYNLNIEQKNNLFKLGYDCMKNFLETHLD